MTTEEITTPEVTPDVAPDVAPEVTPEVTPEEKKLDKENITDKIAENEDKWSEEFDMDSLFKDLFKEEDNNVEELNTTITELNNKLSELEKEKETTKIEVDEINSKLSDYDFFKEQFEKNETAWSKLDENPTLKNIVERFFSWENIDLAWIVEEKILEELDAINNSADNSSDAEKPAWKMTLQQKMFITSQK